MATLYDLAMKYLNQGLPSISGIFQTPTSTTPPVGKPVTPTLPVMPPEKILPKPGGASDNYNVYNTDPNRARTRDDYSPYSYRQAMAKSGAGLPSGILSDSEFLYGKKSPLDSLASMLPGQKILKGIGSLLPVNPRAKLENELLGSGIMLNDIGQIVTNDYNTAEGIMAGYNAAKVTDKTFDKRRDTIEKTLGRKYGLSKSQIEAAKKDPNYTGPRS